jgi:molybdopterin-guanine dinucleotide biosynthesis protein B
MNPMVPYVSIVGYSNSGKTTLICKLIERFTAQGLKVGTLKHDAHDFEMDHEGKDTWKHRQSGASVVMISSDAKVATIESLSEPAQLDRLISRFENVDLVLVEGYKKALAKKIVVGLTLEQIRLRNEVEGVIALATTLNLSESVPYSVFDLNDIDAIASFILKTMKDS